jgi:6-pyruvoyltetrahydropterin/6-carboxytetrahydropterin synthase
MYQLFVEDHFDAAHLIRDYNGKCENTHGHRFKVVIHLEAVKLQKNGLAYDFARIKQSLKAILAKYDHAFLNEISPFERIEPSCENIAATLYDELLPHFTRLPVTLTSVEVWESPTTGVSYKQ